MTAPDRLPDHIEALLELERKAPGMPEAARSRVLARLGESLPPAADAGPTGDGTAIEQAAEIGSSAASSPTPSLLATVAQKPALLATTMFAVGGASGALVYHHAVRPAQPAAVIADAGPAPVVITPAEVALDAGVVEAIDAAVAMNQPAETAEPSLRPPARTAARRDEQLAAERALIEVAREAVARGDASGAIATLARHQRSFARGQLREEREALWIRALVIAKDYVAAAQRAEKFQARYPHSLFAPMIRDALARSRNQP